MKTPKPKMGRPPLDPSDRRESILHIRLSADERAAIECAAGELRASEWARAVLLAKAKRLIA